MKTVYVLGAGFSVEAGAPTQVSIIKDAFALSKTNPSLFDAKLFEKFEKFLAIQLNFCEDEYSGIDLEDIFTPLDKCLNENSQFRGISIDKIMEIREAVFHIVGKTIECNIQKNDMQANKSYIENFAKYLTKASSLRQEAKYNRQDPVSVLSTNWDIILDNAIYNEIQNSSHNAVVDYCCYISSINEHDETIKPGLEKLGQGGFNIKLLKLHGSLNWLQCPRCSRLYAGFSQKIALYLPSNSDSCRHCDKNFPEEQGKHILAANLIMPTYIKDLSNPQYKIIWQNAGIEISEAEKLIFIGYSLPAADFEMRQLLSRMTRKNVKIIVVDYSKDNIYQENIKRHWKKFFGNRDFEFYFEGASSYINKECLL